jgi:RNA polymerase sigma-70 factor (ECF subfamily)
VSDQRAAKDRELAALMRAAQDGDKVAYAGLLRELLPLVQRIVRGKLPFLQPADRDDVVQEVLVSLHTARATYDPRRPFVPWLMAIAHHRMVDRMRRNAKLSAHEVLVDEFVERHVTGEPDLAENDYGDPEALRRAIKVLPAGQRVAIELLKVRELSLTEAATVTGLSIGALKVSAHRAIRSLRHSLASWSDSKKSIGQTADQAHGPHPPEAPCARLEGSRRASSARAPHP